MQRSNAQRAKKRKKLATDFNVRTAIVSVRTLVLAFEHQEENWEGTPNPTRTRLVLSIYTSLRFYEKTYTLVLGFLQLSSLEIHSFQYFCNRLH